MVEGIELNSVAVPLEEDGRPTDSMHGPIEVQIRAAPSAGHCSERSSPPVFPEGSAAIGPMSSIVIPAGIAPDSSLQRTNAAALLGSSVRVESARRTSARNLRIKRIYTPRAERSRD